MTNAEIIIALATFFGPIVAIQVERWLARQREKEDRRLAIFRTLMSTRATTLTAEHVNALNAIPIEFYGRKSVIDRWEEYFAHLHKKDMDQKHWILRRIDLLNTLLATMGADLKYKFNAREMESVYSPQGHNAIENAQLTILEGLADVFRGKQVLPMEVTNLRDEKINEALLKVLKGEAPLRLLDELQARQAPFVRED